MRFFFAVSVRRKNIYRLKLETFVPYSKFINKMETAKNGKVGEGSKKRSNHSESLIEGLLAISHDSRAFFHQIG